jgi:hypothetical protein
MVVVRARAPQALDAIFCTPRCALEPALSLPNSQAGSLFSRFRKSAVLSEQQIA